MIGDRCFKCGRRRCPTCGGTQKVERLCDDGELALAACPDCEDGWVEPDAVPSRSMTKRLDACSDPNVLCPGCEEKPCS